MALSQPSIITPVQAIVIEGNTARDLTINFSYGSTTGSDIATSTIVKIYEYNSSDVVLTDTRTLTTLTTTTHVIPSTVIAAANLTTEKQYQITITTQSANGTLSAESAKRNIWVLNPNTVTITSPITGITIDTTSVNVTARYNTGIQNTSILVNNNIGTYTFELMQGDNTILSSGALLGDNAQQINDTTFDISFVFTNIPSSTQPYTILITIQSNQEMLATDSIQINVDVPELEFDVASVTNNVCEGYISVDCNIIAIDGEIVGNENLENKGLHNGWIDLTTNAPTANLEWDTGYTFPTTLDIQNNSLSNWTMQIWGFNFLPIESSAPYYNYSNGGLTLATTTNIYTATILGTNNQYLVQLRSTKHQEDTSQGEIDLFIATTENNQIYASLYAYPYACQGSYGVSQYIESEPISMPTVGNPVDITNSEGIMLWVQSYNGYYDIRLVNTGMGGVN